MRMPFSPFRTKRPSEFQVRTPGHVGGLGFLPSDEHDVAKAVVVESGHGVEILRQEFTLA